MEKLIKQKANEQIGILSPGCLVTRVRLLNACRYFHFILKCSLEVDSESVQVHLKLLLLALHVVKPKVSAVFGQGDIKLQTFLFGRGEHNHFKV